MEKKYTHKNAVILYKKLAISKGTKGSGKRSREVKLGKHMVLTTAKVFLIAFKDGVNLDIQTEIVDSDGRFNIIETIINESNIVIVNYYAPNDEPSQGETLAKIDRHIRSLELEDNTTFLFRGDFNMYFDTKLDGGNPKLKVNSLT